MVDAWATPSASDGLAETLSPGMGARERANWPTPQAATFNDGQTVEAYLARKERERAKGYNGNGGGTPLAMEVRLWPTATAGDSRSSGSAGYGTENGRAEGTTLTDATVRGIRAGATESKPTKGLKLNPAWVEQLMGFPPGWTLLDPESRNTTGKRRASSRKRKTAPTG